jgi:UDP-glucose 4-epimerase
MKHLLVTGGLGFLGSELVKTLLAAGYKNIHVLDDVSTGSMLNRYQGVTYHRYNVCDREKLAGLMQSVSFECIFHFAALPRILPSFLDPFSHNDANVIGTLVLLETFNRYTKPDCVFINSSSSSVYGSPLTTPSEETDKVSPLNPYALQKYTAETYVTLLCRYWDRKFTNLRYFNPYGP